MKVDFDSSKIFFIGGAPRSGTTLMQRILTSHSLVFGGPEFDLIPSVMKLRNMFHASVDAGRISEFLDHDNVDEIFREFVISAFKKSMQGKSKKKYFSEKTPFNTEVFVEIAETFPLAKLILVVRDPRSIVSSMLEVGEKYKKEGHRGPKFTRDVRNAIYFINELWGVASKVIDKNNMYVVFYEDIVLNPNAVIYDITKKLGLVFEKSMVQIEKQKTITAEFKGDELMWYSKEKLQSPIDKKSLEKWKSQLSAYELFVINKRLRQISGITDRYQLAQQSNLIFKVIDIVGNALFDAKKSLTLKPRNYL